MKHYLKFALSALTMFLISMIVVFGLTIAAKLYWLAIQLAWGLW